MEIMKYELHERHGLSKHELYRTWANIKTRCYNNKDKRFKDYGGRGITVCERWLNSFTAFLQDMGERPEGTTIDRVDNNGNYEPSNCKWSTNREQAINKRKPKNNKSGTKGIHFHKGSNKWRPQIHANGKRLNLGIFDKKEDAIQARKEAEELYLTGLDTFLIII